MNALAKQAGRFTETVIDDEIVVMRLDNGEFFSLSGTAAATWLLIDGTRDRSVLITALATKFGVDEATIATDIDDFLARLRENGLLAGL